MLNELNRRKGEKVHKSTPNEDHNDIIPAKPSERLQQQYKRKLFYILATLTLLNFIAGSLFILRFYYQDHLPPYKISNDYITWNIDENEQFARKAADGAKPMLIKGSVVNKWYAMKRWNIDYLTKKINKLNNVYTNTNKWFGPYYDPNKDFAPFVARRNPYKDDVTMKSADFFQHISTKVEEQDLFLYYTGGIDSIGQWASVDVQPIEELISLKPSHNSINVWLGEPGVIAHMHYCEYHNFYVQIQGSKKFTVFSPSEWIHVYPYPYLHPHHAQAQVNISNVNDTDKFPFITKATGMEITLEPGDLLYLPPLWFHHVEALETSISVNAWSDSEQTPIVKRIFSHDVPISEENERNKAISTVLIIDGIFDRVCARKKCLGLIEEELWNRYNTTYQVVLKRKSTYQLFKMYKIRYKLTQRVLEYSIGSHSPWSDEYNGMLCEGEELYEELVRDVIKEMYSGRNKVLLNAYLQNIANLVAKLPNDTWEIWLGNYIEFLAFNTVPVEMVGNFFKHSFSCLEIAFENSLL
ncbi:hypothetical protein LOD99_3264 [Oopsacas minuta]|uniref:JmjC domain-containing protein n=1 Tax=Oopsacas minuta TaxID=111878 RepID=A0AAV7JY80_9METZ|nr:hypothetical protein LOD99_3264 [Oopsacas minuta]